MRSEFSYNPVMLFGKILESSSDFCGSPDFGWLEFQRTFQNIAVRLTPNNNTSTFHISRKALPQFVSTRTEDLIPLIELATVVSISIFATVMVYWMRDDSV